MTFQFFHSPAGQVKSLKIEALGLDMAVRMPPDVTGGELTVLETANAPGFGPPLHRHRETEIFRVLEGRYLFQVDDKQFEAGEGDVVTVPGGAVHAFVNVTDRPARQRFYRSAGRRVAGPRAAWLFLSGARRFLSPYARG